ncbi:MAG: succinate dehydrogenase, cytochrome b556 subunit [Hyphomicrobiaceae bacterium]|nr:succinate dehydrogenase, cytochrome b556 subunit [Hyphomicrobiaceae bacterium]
MASANPAGKRPLSPHLQIYRPMLTMLMSILHRATGAALYFGTLLVAWWLFAAAAGPEYYDFASGFANSFIGRLILFGYTWSLIHHMLGGLRHFIWDTGRGFDLPTVELLARATIIGSLTLTVLIWVIAYAVRGAF